MTKKIVTPVIKNKLIELGFKEIVIGTKQEHEINSKNVKIDFFGYDIAIGLSAQAINYASRRKYIALVINLKN